MSTNPFMTGMVLFFFFLNSGMVSAQELTLGETVRRAVETSGSVAVQEMQAQESLLDAETAHSLSYPQLAFGANAKYVSKVMKISMPGRTIQFGSNDSWDVSLSLNQNVYDAGRSDALEQVNHARARMSLLNADASRLQVEFNAKTAFFRVILSQRLLSAAEQSRGAAEIHLADIQTRLSQGMAIRNDVVSAQLRVSTTDLDIASQRAELARSQAAFRSITGMDPGTPVNLAWSGSYAPVFADTSLAQVQKARPEFAAFDAAQEASQRAAEATRAGLYPTVGLNAGYHYGKPGLDLPANQWMGYASAGVLLNWNFWDWGTTRREMEKSRISAQMVEENRDDFTRAVQQSLDQSLATLREMQERLTLAAESANFAETNLNTITASYRQGMATETDYDTAYNSFTVANITVAAAEVSVWISAAQVEYVLGIRNTGE